MATRFSFQSWILGGTLLVVACTLTFVGVLMQRSLRGEMVELVERSLNSELTILSEVVRDRWQTFRAPGAEHGLAEFIAGRLEAGVTLVDAQGRVLAQSGQGAGRGDSMARENLLDQAEVARALKGGLGRDIHDDPTLGVEVLYLARALGFPDGGKVVIRVEYPLGEVDQTLANTRRLIVGAVFLGVLLSIGVAWLVARHLSLPVRDLTVTASHIAKGDLSRRFRHYPSHEIGDLGRAFDAMADNLEARIEEVTHARDRLEAILKGMVEGVLVTDRDGNVLLANQALRDLLEVPHIPEGRLPSEIIRNAGLLEALDQVQANGGHTSREIRVLGKQQTRILEAQVVGLSDREPAAGAVAVLHDLTERKRIDQMRRDFVANVSHELRTPLTAIRGSAETLLDGALDSPKYARHFAEMIERHTHRLEALVQDLLNLARLESGENSLNRREIEPAELAEEALDTVAELAAAKGLELALELPKDLPPFSADQAQLRQALVNLLDNAVKYGGGKVRLSFRTRGEDLLIEVSDNGPGIPAEHLPRLFERFYRVNKDRSRELGGTGLGLAIVKHVAQAHGGKVEVDSAPGRGATFRLILPLES